MRRLKQFGTILRDGSSLVARQAHILKVKGSNPFPASIWSRSSMAERSPVKRMVVGSSPTVTALNAALSLIGKAVDC